MTILTCVICNTSFNATSPENSFCSTKCDESARIRSLDFFSLEKDIEILYPHRCPHCGGEGCIDGDRSDPCPECQGAGVDPLNTNLRLISDKSPTIGHNLLDRSRPWLHIDEMRVRLEESYKSLRELSYNSLWDDEDDEAPEEE